MWRQYNSPMLVFIALFRKEMECMMRFFFSKYMRRSSNGNIFRVNGPVSGIHWSPVDSPYKGQWRRVLMFSLICAGTNGWANNRDAGDLRCHRAHYDVTVMLNCTSPCVVSVPQSYYSNKASRQTNDPPYLGFWFDSDHANSQSRAMLENNHQHDVDVINEIIR